MPSLLNFKALSLLAVVTSASLTFGMHYQNPNRLENLLYTNKTIPSLIKTELEIALEEQDSNSALQCIKEGFDIGDRDFFTEASILDKATFDPYLFKLLMHLGIKPMLDWNDPELLNTVQDNQIKQLLLKTTTLENVLNTQEKMEFEKIRRARENPLCSSFISRIKPSTPLTRPKQ